ncbi:hypothetical protein ACN6LM_000431 [Streptomyces sp. SAS_281]|uniref:hypothetical protein n=1 Tax=Streptomyces sp. SAS_281 TaxID=3412744 RepID=UPI00403CC938
MTIYRSFNAPFRPDLLALDQLCGPPELVFAEVPGLSEFDEEAVRAPSVVAEMDLLQPFSDYAECG